MDEKKKRVNGIIVPSCLAVFLIMSFIGYGELKNKVKTNEESIKKVEETPVKVAVIEEKVINLEENFDEFRTEQKAVNIKVQDTLEEILRAVK